MPINFGMRLIGEADKKPPLPDGWKWPIQKTALIYAEAPNGETFYCEDAGDKWILYPRKTATAEDVTRTEGRLKLYQFYIEDKQPYAEYPKTKI